MAGTFTRINGAAYSHASCDFNILGRSRPWVKEISYSDNLEPGEVRGVGAQLLGRTTGEYKSEASITLAKGAAEEIREEIGDGFLQHIFDIIVTRQEQNMSTIIDTIARCRIKKVENSSATGSDGSEEKWDLHPMYILWNGWSPILGLVKG